VGKVRASVTCEPEVQANERQLWSYDSPAPVRKEPEDLVKVGQRPPDSHFPGRLPLPGGASWTVFGSLVRLSTRFGNASVGWPGSSGASPRKSSVLGAHQAKLRFAARRPQSRFARDLELLSVQVVGRNSPPLIRAVAILGKRLDRASSGAGVCCVAGPGRNTGGTSARARQKGLPGTRFSVLWKSRPSNGLRKHTQNPHEPKWTCTTA